MLAARCTLFVTAGTFCFILIIAFYRYPGFRFFYAALILSVFVVVNFFEATFRKEDKAFSKSRTVGMGWTTITFCLFLLVLSGFPSQSDFLSQGPRRMQLFDLADHQFLGKQSFGYNAIKRFVEMVGEEPALVVVHTRSVNVVLASSLLSLSIIVIPEDREHRWRYSRIWRFAEAERNQYLIQAQRNGLPIYYLGVQDPDPSVLRSMADVVSEACWKPLLSIRRIKIYRLQSGDSGDDDAAYCPEHLDEL